MTNEAMTLIKTIVSNLQYDFLETLKEVSVLMKIKVKLEIF